MSEHWSDAAKAARALASADGHVLGTPAWWEAYKKYREQLASSND